MKVIFLFLLGAGLFASCNNDGTHKEAPDTTGSHQPAIDNVNGNIPDTTNSIRLDGQDSTHR